MHPHLPLALALTGLLPAGCSGESIGRHGHGDTGVEAERSAQEHSPPRIDTTTIAIEDPERLGIASDDFYGIPRDSDNDGLFDHVERQHGLDPHNRNSDLDWIGDHWLLLGSRLSPQYYGQTAWFDLGPRAVSVSPPDDEARLNAPLFGIYFRSLESGGIVLFGTDTGRPLIVDGERVGTDEYLWEIHADVSDVWEDSGDLQLQLASVWSGVGFSVLYKIVRLGLDEDGNPTQTDLTSRRYLPLEPPTRRYVRGVYGPDTDADYILDDDEALYGTDPFAWDTDDDGIPDGVEISYGHDPLSEDTDGDGILDMDEYLAGTADIMYPHPGSHAEP